MLIHGAQPFLVVDGVLELSLVFRELRLGLSKRSLIRARVDLEQQVAGLHEVAFLEMRAVDDALHARGHLHRGVREYRADRTLHDRHVAALGHRDAHRGGRGLEAALARAGTAAIHISECAQDRDERDSADQPLADLDPPAADRGGGHHLRLLHVITTSCARPQTIGSRAVAVAAPPSEVCSKDRRKIRGSPRPKRRPRYR